jgi:predicted TIM-barrel fold metal-dependent hydrolase
MIVDAHLHHYERGFFSPRWHDYVAQQWGRRNPPERDPAIIRPKIEDGMEDPGGNRMVEHLDAAGVDVGVLHPLDWELGFRQPAPVSIRTMHEVIAGVAARHPGRFVAFAGIDPQREDAVELFEWAVNSLGMRGLKLYPPTGFYPYDRRVYPLYERCEAWGLPVLCHTGGPGIALLPARYANPIYLQDVQADFPEMKLWIAHAGHRIFWEEAAAVAAVGINTYLELSTWQAIAESEEEFYVRWLATVRDRVGAHRIVWGSDHIAGTRVRGKQKLVDWVAWFRDLPERAQRYAISFTQDEVEAILGGNAARCLGIEGSLEPNGSTASTPKTEGFPA